METSSPAYRIQDGKIETIHLPEASGEYIVPENIWTDGGNGVPVMLALLPGREDEYFSDYTVQLVEQLATRITPWATWYLTPGFTADPRWSGTAWRDDALAVCRTNRRAHHVVQTAFHEAWHLCENMIGDADLARLDSQLAKDGPQWPGEYFPSATERRARAFGAFSAAILEGVRIAVDGPGASYECSLFWHVYSGGFARQIMRPEPTSEPTPSRMSQFLAAVWK